MMENLIAAWGIFFQLQNIAAVFFGMALGVLLGAIPGLTATMAIALMIPLTFYMSPVAAIAMLVGAYKGGCYGGSIPAILLNTPGTPAAAATVLDGYPLAKQGKSLKALKMAMYASIIGDGFCDICLILVAPPLAYVALKMGPPETASLILLSLMIITVVAGKSLLRGLLAAALGLLLGTVGMDPMTSTPRLGFGFIELDEGLSLIPMLIGLFAISEVFYYAASKNWGTKGGTLHERSTNPDDNRVTGTEFKGALKIIFTACGIGTFLGAVPGIGPTVAAFASYGQAKKMSKHPEKFGNGAIDGVAAAEAGNNAVAGSNLIPLLTLGIPGDIGAAVLLGAFMMQGLHPGPLLFQENIDLIYAIFMTLIMANIAMFFWASIFIRVSNRVTDIPPDLIFPAVLVFCAVGSYAINQNLFDVWAALLFGILGYIMRRADFPVAPLLIAFVLEPLLERAFRQSILMSGGNLEIFVTSPLSLLFLALTVLSVIMMVRGIMKKKIVIADKDE